MTGASPEMIHRHTTTTVTSGNDVSVFERQQARMKWQQQQRFFNVNNNQVVRTYTTEPKTQISPGGLKSDPPVFNNQSSAGVPVRPHASDASESNARLLPDSLNRDPSPFNNQIPNMLSSSMQPFHFSGLVENIKPDPDMQNGWSDFSDDQFPPLMVDQKILLENSSSISLSPKKRKPSHESLKLKVGSTENGKKIKGCCEDNSIENSPKGKSKAIEAQKQDYIHVRARRGQATDSHSLAERVRREKISERMKYLQDLVPGCNKVTGKAGMLDEIINYVQSLQKQVEFLSMKLASLHPRLDFDIDSIITKEMFEVSTIGYTCEMANSAYFQLNSLLEMGNNPIDSMLRRSIGGHVSTPETLVVSSCFNQMQPSVTWDGDLHNLYKMEYQQESSTISYQNQKFTGSYEGNNLKMEM